jgi:hypothetical protein
MSQKQAQLTSIADSLIDIQTLIFTFLLSAAIFLPSIIHQQVITGPLVNAILLIAVMILNPSSALMVGLIPSVVALSRGLLPLALAPMIPFIMLGNSIYIFTFSKLYKKSFVLAVIAAASFKFGLLHGVSQWILPSLLPNKLLTKASLMMSWPQLVTALAGGFIAWLMVRVILDQTEFKTK